LAVGIDLKGEIAMKKLILFLLPLLLCACAEGEIATTDANVPDADEITDFGWTYINGDYEPIGNLEIVKTEPNNLVTRAKVHLAILDEIEYGDFTVQLRGETMQSQDEDFLRAVMKIALLADGVLLSEDALHLNARLVIQTGVPIDLSERYFSVYSVNQDGEDYPLIITHYPFDNFYPDESGYIAHFYTVKNNELVMFQDLLQTELESYALADIEKDFRFDFVNVKAERR
jgi:hypothetical protein